MPLICHSLGSRSETLTMQSRVIKVSVHTQLVGLLRRSGSKIDSSDFRLGRPSFGGRNCVLMAWFDLDLSDFPPII